MKNITLTSNEQEFLTAYLEAIYFTDTSDDEQPAVDAELDSEFLRESTIDCLSMYSRLACYLSDNNVAQAGHDFWLTRNGHGTGYWDRPEVYGEHYASMFTECAESFEVAHSCWKELY
jgi:hypothetical protein